MRIDVAETSGAGQVTELMGSAPASAAGPIDSAELAGLAEPPTVQLPRAMQVLRFNMRQIEFVFGARRRLGEVFRIRGTVPGGPVVTSHPEHVKSLFTAKPDEAPSLTGESRSEAGRRRIGADRRRRASHAPAQAAAAVLPRRGDRQLPADDHRGDRARDRPLADRPADPARAAHAEDHPRRDHGRHLRDRGPAGPGHARVLAAPGHAHAALRVDAAARAARRAHEHRQRRAGRHPARRHRAARPPHLRGHQGAPQGSRRRGAARHPVAADRRPHRGGRGAHRPRAAQRAADARARRARDDGQPAGVDVGAPRAQSRRPRAADRGDAGRRRRGGDGRRGDAQREHAHRAR